MFKNCTINGEKEHILNRKARINGKVVDNQKKLSLIKSYNKKQTEQKIKNILKVYSQIHSKDFKVSRDGNIYNIGLDKKEIPIEIDTFGAGVNARIKGIIKELL